METEQENISVVLSRLQGELKNPPKNRTVNTGKYEFSYATLDSILDQIREPMAQHGLALVQRGEIHQWGDGKIQQTLVTEILFGTQKLSSSFALPVLVNMQELGACLSYVKRYALCAMLRITSEDDTDGPPVDNSENEARAERLAKMARAGKLTSANTGKPITEADVNPNPKPPLVEPAEQKTEQASVPDEPGDQLPFDTELPPRMMALLKKDGVTTEQFRLYIIKRGLYPDTIQLSKIPDAKIETYITNWKTISERIRGAK